MGRTGGGREVGAQGRLEIRWGRWIGKEGRGGSLYLTLIPSNLIFSVVRHRVVITLNVIQH